MSTTHPPPIEEKLLTTKELALLLNLHYHTIYEMVHRNAIPVIRIGGRYRFNKSEVLSALKAPHQ